MKDPKKLIESDKTPEEIIQGITERLTDETDWNREDISHIGLPSSDIDDSKQVDTKYFTFNNWHYALYVDHRNNIVLHGNPASGGEGEVYKTFRGGKRKAEDIMNNLIKKAREKKRDLNKLHNNRHFDLLIVDSVDIGRDNNRGPHAISSSSYEKYKVTSTQGLEYMEEEVLQWAKDTINSGGIMSYIVEDVKFHRTEISTWWVYVRIKVHHN